MNEPDEASNHIAVTTNIQYTPSDAPCMAGVIDADLLKLCGLMRTGVFCHFKARLHLQKSG